MPTDVNSVSLAASLFAEFFRILIYLVLIILGLRIIWRVEKRLDWVFKLLTLSFVVVLLRQLVRLLVSLEVLKPVPWLSWFDILPALLSLVAFMVMNNLINRMEKEK